jgi:nucleoside-diphosphate-sugar epimerase
MPWNDQIQRLVPTNATRTAESPPPMRVLVTGAAGFLGARVVEAMLISGFAEPVAAIRQWSRAARVACHPVEIVICDITNREQVDAAMDRIDAIVHCAYSDDNDSIVNGTRNLLEAALRNRVQKFVYLSSAEAYGPGGIGNMAEESNPQPAPDSYGEFKLAAERVCQEYHARGLKPTILRPSLIYGPFGVSWSIHVANRLQSGKWGLFDSYGNGIANLVYVDDLVQAILLSLTSDRALGQTFNVNGPERPTWNAYFELFNESLQLPPLQRISAAKSKMRTHIMEAVGSVTTYFKSKFEDQLMEIYLRGGFLSRMMKRLKGELDSTPSKGELNNLYARKASYDITKIQQLLGYSPRFDLRQGIEKTIEWFVHHEIVNQTKIEIVADGRSPSPSALNFSELESDLDSAELLTKELQS